MVHGIALCHPHRPHAPVHWHLHVQLNLYLHPDVCIQVKVGIYANDSKPIQGKYGLAYITEAFFHRSACALRHICRAFQMYMADVCIIVHISGRQTALSTLMGGLQISPPVDLASTGVKPCCMRLPALGYSCMHCMHMVCTAPYALPPMHCTIYKYALNIVCIHRFVPIPPILTDLCRSSVQRSRKQLKATLKTTQNP